MAREEGVEFISVEGHVSVDQRPFVNAVVVGSKQVFDVLKDADSILDPAGDEEYAREASKGQWEDFDYCACPTHEGGRWLPVTQFSFDKSTPHKRKRWCRKCRADAEHERRIREAERRGVLLRDKAGRPPKHKKGRHS